ncbi:nucleotidyltransferase family protein [Hydrogenimonas sp.]
MILSKGITSVALFGSFAKDKATPYSDVDIAIRKSPDFLQKKGSYAYFDLIDEIKVLLRQKLHRNIDIFDLDSDSPFKEMVEREMIRV